MHLTDPIADLLTRLRNAQKARHSDIRLPSSAMKVQIAEILKKEGFIASYAVEKEKTVSWLTIELKYEHNGGKVIHSLDRISKPGKRVYKGYEDLANEKDVITLQIVSTSKGVMSDREATEAKLGGEVICKIS